MDNRKNGVKVISANENISEGSKGIILEYVLEGMAEYYSADLSEKVILPMIVLKCFDDILSPTLPKKPLLKRLKNFKHILPTKARPMISILQTNSTHCL